VKRRTTQSINYGLVGRASRDLCDQVKYDLIVWLRSGKILRPGKVKCRAR
jgi:hypothetical protein